MSDRSEVLKAINKLFEKREPWQIISMTASSVLVAVWAHSLYNAKETPTTRLRKQFFRWLRYIPFVQRKIDEKMDEIKRDFKRDVAKRLDGVPIRREIPEVGFTPEAVAEEILDLINLGSYDWRGGNVSGAVYHLDQDIVDVACAAYAATAYTNPLHADVFPGVNKMEAEIVRMAVNLFHGDDECCGTVTTGGTESIMMACKAFRDLAYDRGISNPQMILPTTAHTAFDKAAQYLGISVVTVPVSSDTLTVNVDDVRRAICRRTCMIVGSAPNFPYGTMDDISALSDLAVEYGIPLHVDACLGGFLAAFMPAAGYPVPPFDFRLPGVCSMSADTHKYGFAPKGTSVVLYRKPEYRHCQYTVTTDWPGGVYGSPTVNGSRAGGLIAACWATMMYVGRERYVRMAREVLQTTKYIERELRSIDGIYIFGKPATSVIAFGSNKFDIFKLADHLHKKGWSLNTLQFPSGVHICVTHTHTRDGVAARFVSEVRDATRACLAEGSEPVQGKMAIYGVAQSIPDRSLVSDITKHFIDSLYYLPTPEDKVEKDIEK
ncbi:sphingosine-1-phosphate lyase [Aricia agestis]|uniref:sphingosine-1-phosphate lyase n=1 Tax=Aricia agestis TaxID=91739 RepID=UPI001C20B1B7|nr:sphingosine-1-phosphate lyase [Aricia agestis]XP_041970536.1 sphingosine-1-phosphate lyase [Aricia agestis]